MEGYTFVLAICFFVISITTIHIAADDDSMEDLINKTAFETCAKKMGITKEQFEKSMKTLSSSADVKAQKDVLCFIKCLAEEMGIVGSKGEINMNKVKESIPKDQQAKYDGYTKCMEKIEKISICEDMLQMLKCAENVK